MNMNSKYVSSAKTLCIGHIHKRRYPQPMHEMMLSQDLCGNLSYEFSPDRSSTDFYTIKSSDSRLHKLLVFNLHGSFEYKFEKVLSQSIRNLCLAPKAYMEFGVTYDEENRVIGVSLIPFDAIKVLKLKKTTIFFAKKSNGRFFFFKISTNRYVEFDIRKAGIKKSFFKRTVRKLKHVELNRCTKLWLDKGMENKFDFSKWKTKAEFLTLKYPSKIGWLCRDYSNSLLSESYLLYRCIRFKLFRKSILEYLLKIINTGIEKLSEEIAAEGKIVIPENIVDYESEWRRYARGEICASELSDIILKIC